MLQLPFDIPQSLASYAENFEEHPEKATHRLQKQLEKRGPDAVGYFLLAWFYFRQGKQEQAVEEALKARIFAPGSLFFRKFHYYLSHPDLFDAWVPDTRPERSTFSAVRNEPILDLDNLIQKLSAAETQRIKLKMNLSDDSQSSNKIDAGGDEIYSETLARIHEDQGKIDTAIHSYRQLRKIKPEKSDYFTRQIERLQKMKGDSEEE